jgi:hypothetical protein
MMVHLQSIASQAWIREKGEGEPITSGKFTAYGDLRNS